VPCQARLCLTTPCGGDLWQVVEVPVLGDRSYHPNYIGLSRLPNLSFLNRRIPRGNSDGERKHMNESGRQRENNSSNNDSVRSAFLYGHITMIGGQWTLIVAVDSGQPARGGSVVPAQTASDLLDGDAFPDHVSGDLEQEVAVRIVEIESEST
jgi:hypothetical protein